MTPYAEAMFMAQWLGSQRGGTTRLEDGTVGYHMRRYDDCWQAAAATCLRIQIRHVPDARIDELVRRGEDPDEIERAYWETFHHWLKSRGRRMVVHKKKRPDHLDRWIGVVLLPERFMSHALVMRFGELLFDPNSSVFNGGRQHKARWRGQPLRLGPEDITYGYSFPRIRSRKAARATEQNGGKT